MVLKSWKEPGMKISEDTTYIDKVITEDIERNRLLEFGQVKLKIEKVTKIFFTCIEKRMHDEKIQNVITKL